MPRFIVRHLVDVALDVEMLPRVLEGAEQIGFAVTNAQDEVASANSVDHAVDGIVQRQVKLQNIAE